MTDLTLAEKIATHVAMANHFLQSAEREPLFGTAKATATAFMQAVKNDDFVVPGNDPHKLVGDEQTSLGRAIGNAYGFTNNPQIETINPKSVQALGELRKAADLIRAADFCLHT